MNPYPKPKLVKKPSPHPPKRTKPIPRGKAPERGKRPKFGNAYTKAPWLKLVAKVRKRSGGLCEMRVHCDGAPAVGHPEHLGYNREFAGPKRLLVPLSRLRDACRRDHLAYEKRRDEIGEDAAEAEYLAWETRPFIEEAA